MWNSSPNLGSHYVFLCPSYNPCERGKYILPVPGDVASSSGPESPVPSPGLGISMQVSAPWSVCPWRKIPPNTNSIRKMGTSVYLLDFAGATWSSCSLLPITSAPSHSWEGTRSPRCIPPAHGIPLPDPP